MPTAIYFHTHTHISVNKMTLMRSERVGEREQMSEMELWRQFDGCEKQIKSIFIG